MTKAVQSAEVFQRKSDAQRGNIDREGWNPLTAHPHRQGISYFEHWQFAMGIAFRLLASVVAFALHAILPFLPIAPRLDLEATAAYLKERNRWIEAASRRSPSPTTGMPRGIRPV